MEMYGAQAEAFPRAASWIKNNSIPNSAFHRLEIARRKVVLFTVAIVPDHLRKDTKPHNSHSHHDIVMQRIQLRYSTYMVAESGILNNKSPSWTSNFETTDQRRKLGAGRMENPAVIPP